MLRPCEVCAGPLPPGSTARRRYCSPKCKGRGQVHLRLAWAADNRESSRAISRRWREANREQQAAIMRAYYAGNREVFARLRHVRRLREGADASQVTARDWRRLIARYDGRCAYCGEVAPLTRDHIVPLSRGGRHSIGNLIPACRRCNGSKGARLLVEWRATRKAIA